MEDASLERHLANAANPAGEYGAQLLARMNAGNHERLSQWAFAQMSMRDDIDIPKAANMLDLGCGGGANLMRLHCLRPAGTVRGIDHSAVSVAASLETCAALVDQGVCAVVQGDVASLPYADASFDLVTAFETVYFWPDFPAALAEARRVTAPGGVILVCNEVGGAAESPDWAHDLPVYSASDLEEALAKAGFSHVETAQEASGWVCAVGLLA